MREWLHTLSTKVSEGGDVAGSHISSTHSFPFKFSSTLALFRSNYGSHEARRQLCSSYDLFVADERILVLLPKLLGESNNRDLMAVCKNSSTGTPSAIQEESASSFSLKTLLCRKGILQKEKAACTCSADGQGLDKPDTTGL